MSWKHNWCQYNTDVKSKGKRFNKTNLIFWVKNLGNAHQKIYNIRQSNG